MAAGGGSWKGGSFKAASGGGKYDEKSSFVYSHQMRGMSTPELNLRISDAKNDVRAGRKVKDAKLRLNLLKKELRVR